MPLGVKSANVDKSQFLWLVKFLKKIKQQGLSFFEILLVA